jgi:hypothetical protein
MTRNTLDQPMDFLGRDVVPLGPWPNPHRLLRSARWANVTAPRWVGMWTGQSNRPTARPAGLASLTNILDGSAGAQMDARGFAHSTRGARAVQATRGEGVRRLRFGRTWPRRRMDALPAPGGHTETMQ